MIKIKMIRRIGYCKRLMILKNIKICLEKVTRNKRRRINFLNLNKLMNFIKFIRQLLLLLLI